VVLAVLVVPGRLLAAEHAMDHELVPYAGAGCTHVTDAEGPRVRLAGAGAAPSTPAALCW
jgi:hypothetical protein